MHHCVQEKSLWEISFGNHPDLASTLQEPAFQDLLQRLRRRKPLKDIKAEKTHLQFQQCLQNPPPACDKRLSAYFLHDEDDCLRQLFCSLVQPPPCDPAPCKEDISQLEKSFIFPQRDNERALQAEEDFIFIENDCREDLPSSSQIDDKTLLRRFLARFF